MRFTTVLLMSAAMALTGCSDLVPLHSFVPEDYATFDPALTGAWDDSDGALYLIKQDGKGYAIRYTEKDGVLKYSALLYKNGDMRLLDLTTSDGDPFQLKVHTPARVWVDGDTLRFAWLDSKWLRDEAQKTLGFHEVERRTLLSAPGDAVLRVLLTSGAGEQAHGKAAELTRVR